MLDPEPELFQSKTGTGAGSTTLLRTIFHSNLVNVVIEEAAAGVEVNILELSLADELVGNLPLEVHEQLQHVIVRLTGEHDFS